MPWARLDDEFFTHPKVREAWRTRAAIGLYALALSYSMRHGTEGQVPTQFVADQLPNRRECAAAVAALVGAGLWESNGDGAWTIHDFLDYNPSRSDIEARRESDRQRKQEARRGSQKTARRKT